MKTYHSFKEASTRYSSTRNAFLSILPMWSTNSVELEQFICYIFLVRMRGASNNYKTS